MPGGTISQLLPSLLGECHGPHVPTFHACSTPLQSHVARRALQQTGGSMASTVVVPIDTKLSLYNISGTWVGIGDQFDASE